MVTDYNYTYCDEDFAMHINIKSLCYTPEANIVLCQVYFNKKIYKMKFGYFTCRIKFQNLALFSLKMQENFKPSALSHHFKHPLQH